MRRLKKRIAALERQLASLESAFENLTVTSNAPVVNVTDGLGGTRQIPIGVSSGELKRNGDSATLNLR